MIPSLRLSLAAVFCLSLAACGSTDDNNTRDAGSNTPDAGNVCQPSCAGAVCGDDDGCGGTCAGTCDAGETCNTSTKICQNSSNDCSVPAEFDNVTLLDPIADADAAAPTEAIYYSALLDDTAVYDTLEFELYGDEGTLFEGAVETGSYELTGEQTDYATCALCVLLYSDNDDANDTGGAIYMPTSGTLTLTSVEGRLTGSLTNVTLVEVEIGEDFATTPVAGGCSTLITSASFDTEIELF